MKKSRIIIPALAMIAFSVAASITGTVAWFSANRTAKIDAGTYAVVKTTSNLNVTVSGGEGTSATNNIVTVGGKLTDGSFEHRTNAQATSPAATAPTIFTPAENGTQLASTNGRVLLSAADAETNLLRGKTADQTPVNIYTAVTFELEFEITFGASQKDIALYLDCHSQETINNESVYQTRLNASSTATAQQKDTAKGFRMAFVPNNSEDAVAKVYAGLQDGSGCFHLDGSVESGWTSANNYGGVQYSSDLIDKDFHTDFTNANAITNSNYSSRVDYLGKFEYGDKDSSNKVTLSYTVVCWFEGTDTNIQDSEVTVYQSVAAHLAFEAIDIPAAAQQQNP